MAKPVVIKQFGGMTPNLREDSYNFALSCHFNIFRHGKLTPNPSYITLTDGGEKVVRFLYAKYLDGAAIVYHLYGLGDDGAGKPKMFHCTLGGTVWTAGLALTGGAKINNVFFEYKDYAYGWQGTTKLWQVGPLSGSQSATDAWQTLTAFTNVGQPVHHKADDYAYFFVDNLVYRFTGASSTTVWSLVLTLPNNMKIIGGVSYGNYLGIVCSPLELGATNSVLYLWDRDASLVTLTSKIDLGMGEAIHCCEAEDGGCWITQQARRTSGITSRNNYISVKYFNGYWETLEIPFGNTQDYFSSIKLVGNAWEERGIFYFPAEIITTGAAETRNVIFAARRKGGKIELIVDQEITGVTADQNINGIFSVGGIWYVSYNTAAQTLQQRVASTYPTCVYESKIFDDGDPSLTKKLKKVTVMTSPLPATASVSLYYRKDEETAWTLIFTHTSTNSVSHSAINIESSGATLPRYKEIQFKISSTVGAEINGFKYLPELIDKDIASDN